MAAKKSLINHWAAAISDIAISENKVDSYIEQATIIIEVLKANPEFVSLLSVHEGSDSKRLEIIDKTFTKKDFDQYVINSLKLIAERDLMFSARDIFKEVRKRLDKHSDLTFGVVWSTTELTEKTIETLSAKISKKLNANVVLINKIDKSLLGGVQVVVQGQNFDGSLKGKLEDMKNNILTNRE